MSPAHLQFDTQVVVMNRLGVTPEAAKEYFAKYAKE
jgi:alanine racemase